MAEEKHPPGYQLAGVIAYEKCMIKDPLQQVSGTAPVLLTMHRGPTEEHYLKNWTLK